MRNAFNESIVSKTRTHRDIAKIKNNFRLGHIETLIIEDNIEQVRKIIWKTVEFHKLLDYR